MFRLVPIVPNVHLISWWPVKSVKVNFKMSEQSSKTLKRNNSIYAIYNKQYRTANSPNMIIWRNLCRYILRVQLILPQYIRSFCCFVLGLSILINLAVKICWVHPWVQNEFTRTEKHIQMSSMSTKLLPQMQ